MGNGSVESKLSVSLTEEQRTEFHKALKIAVYKELHRKKMITDTQLSRLIQMQDE